MYDSLPAKDIVDDKPVYAIEVGRGCQARYLGKLYSVQFIAKGDYNTCGSLCEYGATHADCYTTARTHILTDLTYMLRHVICICSLRNLSLITK